MGMPWVAWRVGEGDLGPREEEAGGDEGGGLDAGLEGALPLGSSLPFLFGDLSCFLEDGGGGLDSSLALEELLSSVDGALFAALPFVSRSCFFAGSAGEVAFFPLPAGGDLLFEVDLRL